MKELVTFYAERQRIVGDLHLPFHNAPCVVALHGLESSKDSGKWPLVAARLYDEGIACLRFNFRGCGTGLEKSDGTFEDVSLTGRIHDYQAALRFLHETGKVDTSSLGVIGSSFGGMVALAAEAARITAMVVLSTPYSIQEPRRAEYGYHLLPSGRRLKRGFYEDLRTYNLLEAVRSAPPLLILQGSADELVPVEHAEHLYEAAQEPKQLEILPGADHLFSRSDHLKRAVELSVSWFKRYLP